MPTEQLVSQYGEFMRTISLSQRMKDIKAKRENLRVELARFSTDSPVILPSRSQAELDDVQENLNKANATYRRLALAHKARRKHSVSYADQVNQILAMPGVVSLSVYGTVARVALSLRYRYLGACYDLGDWIILIDNAKASLDTQEIRPGFMEGWPHGQEPGYCLELGVGEPHRFCLGINFPTVDNFVEAGRIVEALSVTIACMHTIDPADEPSLVFTYETVKRT